MMTSTLIGLLSTVRSDYVHDEPAGPRYIAATVWDSGKVGN
jgi:hypothetical protein